MKTDVCAACGLPRRLRSDGKVIKHNKPRPSDSGWRWRDNQLPTTCPGSGQPPYALQRTREVTR